MQFGYDVVIKYMDGGPHLTDKLRLISRAFQIQKMGQRGLGGIKLLRKTDLLIQMQHQYNDHQYNHTNHDRNSDPRNPLPWP